jgi:hypothetical protein
MAGRKKDPEQTTEQDETQNVVIPLPKALHRQLRFLSVDRGQPMNALIVEAVRFWWERQREFTKYAETDDRKQQRRR